jgi:hypothetical protein
MKEKAQPRTTKENALRIKGSAHLAEKQQVTVIKAGLAKHPVDI